MLDLVKGIMQVFSHRPRSLSINTPFVNASVEGTEFLVLANADQATVTVFDGRVKAANPQGTVTLVAAGTAEARAAALRSRGGVVRPRDAARWTLHYQPIVAEVSAGATASPGAASPGAATLPAAVTEALALSRRGDVAGAIAVLDRAGATGQTDSRIALVRESLLLMSAGWTKPAPESTRCWLVPPTIATR